MRQPADPVAVPDDNAPLPPARRPTRWNVRRGRTIAFLLIGLAFATSLLSVYLTYETAQDSAEQAAAVDRRLSVLEDDLNERTREQAAERDATAEEQDRFRANLCVVLGDLPADSPNLDRLRQALGCPQPGVTEPAALTPGGAVTPGPADNPGGGSAPPAPPGRTSTPPSPSPPPRPAAGPQPSPPDRGPVGDLVCGLLPLC